MLSAKRNETKYPELVAHLREQIVSGRWKVGERLPTFVQLREELGVHSNTFSRALRDLEVEGLVVREPRRGVFVRNPEDEVPGPAREKTIALILSAFNHQFFAEIVQRVEAACSAYGYRLVLANSNDIGELERELIHKLMNHVAGFIIAPVTGEVSYGHYAALLDRKIPFVLLARRLENLSVAVVESDNRLGGYLAAHHLLKLGRRNLYVLQDYDDSAANDRIAGFRQAMIEVGVRVDDDAICRSDERGEAAGYWMMKSLLEGGRYGKKAGVFALNIQLARGAYLAIREAGLEIPRDIAAAGFDDQEAAYFDPPLTTIRQDMDGMGREAFRVLAKAIAYPDQPREHVLLKPQLIVRNSTDQASNFSLKQHLVNSRELTGMEFTPQNRDKALAVPGS